MKFKTKVKHWMHSLELLIDKMIPYLVILLLVIIIIELGFEEIAHHHHLEIIIIDQFIIFVFILDLVFKYLHVRNIPKFVKLFWLDIIAVFPFFLLFRAIEGISGIVAMGETGQKILHESLELEKEGSKLVGEVEKISKAKNTARFTKFSRFLRPVLRLPRLLKLIPHYSKRNKLILEEKQKHKNNKLKKKSIANNTKIKVKTNRHN